MNILVRTIKKIFLKMKWRKKNTHNYTTMDTMFDMNLVSVGNYTYGGINVLTFNSESYLKIGHFCSIGPNVIFVLSAEHELESVSTYPFKSKLGCCRQEGKTKGDIVVADDVWIGTNAIILSGVSIGQGAVIGSGAVVTKNVAPYAVVGGVPARVIKYRFNDDIIDELLKIDYSKVDRNLILKNMELLYDNIVKKEQLSWLPKKE